MRLLDLFCGEGGAGEGYRRAGFDVTSVDNDPARLANNPNPDQHEADALDFLYRHGSEYDVIHASPTCTGYSRGSSAIPDRMERYDRLIGVVRVLAEATGKPYVIENVEDAKRELHSPVTLCWTDFFQPGLVIDDDGTPLWMRRHRLFESNLPLMGPGGCSHPKAMQCAGAYGGSRRDKHEAKNIRKGGYVPAHHVMRRLLGTEWMSERGCQLSIPPAYTQFLGEQIKDHL